MEIDKDINDKNININSSLKESISIFIKSKINNLINLINSLIFILFIDKNDLEGAISNASPLIIK